METIEFKSHHFSIIGKNSKLTGNIHLEDEVQIWGQIHGNIDSLEKISIERTANIKGEITCHDIIISGQFQGTISSQGSVTIRSSAIISGKILAKNIIVQPGSSVEAEMNTDENL